MTFRLFVVSVLALLSVSCTAQYESVSDNSDLLVNAYGVTSHITRKGERWNYESKQRELKMMFNLNVDWCRSNVDAYNVVTKNGKTSSPIFDEVYNDLARNSIGILPILSDYYNGQFAWQGDWYEKYVTYLSEKYGKKSHYWEVMNEIDHPNSLKNMKNGCSDYVKALKKSHDIIKKHNPSAQILCSSLCDLNYSFLDSLSALGAQNYFDIVNIHSYSEPEILPIHIQNLKGHMKKYGWVKPIWLTETGMSSVSIAEETTNKYFFTDFLPSAMKRIGLTPKNTTISVLRDMEVGYSSLSDDEVNEWLKPICKQTNYVSFVEIGKSTKSSCPILIVSETSQFPMAHFDKIVEYVRRGGTIVLAGGTPLYYDIQIEANGVVTTKQVNDAYYAKLHMSALFWWLDKARKRNVPKVPTVVKNLYSNYKWTFNDTYSSRFMCSDQLKGKDSLITIVEAGDGRFKGCVAGIYKLNSDLTGNVIFQTREGLSGYYKEDLEQARRLPRIFMLSFACGIDKVFWYNFRSAEINNNDKESHFGLVHKNLMPKNSYYAYETITKMLPDGSTRPKLYVDGEVYAASWIDPQKRSMWAVWRRKGRKTEKISLDKNAECYDLFGKKISARSKFDISENVIYFVEQKKNPILRE